MLSWSANGIVLCLSNPLGVSATASAGSGNVLMAWELWNEVDIAGKPKSKKLLLLQVDLGDGDVRQVVSGIKEWYSPEALIDTQVCLVANLKPAKLMGIKSEGMVLAAKDEDGLVLMRPEKPKKTGTAVS